MKGVLYKNRFINCLFYLPMKVKIYKKKKRSQMKKKLYLEPIPKFDKIIALYFYF